MRLPPTPCRVCFRPCVFKIKFSHFWQKDRHFSRVYLDENRRNGSLCGVLVLGAVGQQALFMQRSTDARRGLIDRTLYMEEAAFAQHAQDRASPRRVQRVQLGVQLRDPSVHMASQVDESRLFGRKARDEEKLR